jgi:hypothetical protein
MDVFIVTHSPHEVNGKRVVTTDVWRIFSEAKGSALFHNQALDDIVTYYLERFGLKRVSVFSDGCRAQYKGKNNFARVAQFPSRIGGVQLIHRFAASHHFKGPHDAYGKDAKLLCRTAERNGKVHDVYSFCATMLPRPRREGITADEVVAPLPAVAPVVLSPVQQAEEEVAAAAALARTTTDEARRRLAKRLARAGLASAAEPTVQVEAPAVATELAAQEAGAEAEVRAAAAALDAPLVEAAAQEVGQQAVRAAEADDDNDEAVGGDFVFVNSARVGAGHAAAVASDNEGEAPLAQAMAVAGKGAVSEPVHKKKRRARERRILTQAPGMEASADGESRIETEAPRQPGTFAASAYFWLYYAADGVKGLTKKVGINEGSGPHGSAMRGEYHAILLDAADTDADSVPGSNSTYEFAGVRADKPKDLYLRTYACACAVCKEQSSISIESLRCPLVGTVGRWRQQEVYSGTNAVAQRKMMLDSIKEFLAKIKPDKLYAANASCTARSSAAARTGCSAPSPWRSPTRRSRCQAAPRSPRTSTTSRRNGTSRATTSGAAKSTSCWRRLSMYQ